MVRTRSWSAMVAVFVLSVSVGATLTRYSLPDRTPWANTAQPTVRSAVLEKIAPIEHSSVPPGMKRVVERKSKVINYTVSTPVREVREKVLSYTVTKPVFETREKVVTYTVSHPVEETRESRVTYQVCRVVPEVKTKTVRYTVCRMERERRQKTVEYDEVRYVPIESAMTQI